jgi:hypothetical protein
MTNFAIYVAFLRRRLETVMLLAKDKPTKSFKHELMRRNNKNELFCVNKNTLEATYLVSLCVGEVRKPVLLGKNLFCTHPQKKKVKFATL